MKTIVFLIFLSLQITYQNPYNEQLGKQLFDYNRLAKCELSTIKNWTCGKECKRTEKLIDIEFLEEQSQDIFAIIGYKPSDDAIIIAYRGSTTIINWLNNIKISKVSYPDCINCEIHNGFYSSFIVAIKQLKEKFNIVRIKYPNSKIIVTGHSLGGAYSILTAIQLIKWGQKIQDIYTFGMPRMGNQNFIDYLKTIELPKEIHRVVNKQDPVPKVPPKSLGYSHIQPEIFYDKNEKDYKICQVENDKQCSAKYIIPSFKDHRGYFELYEVPCEK